MPKKPIKGGYKVSADWTGGWDHAWFDDYLHAHAYAAEQVLCGALWAEIIDPDGSVACEFEHDGTYAACNG
jgi:hypothetical protein